MSSNGLNALKNDLKSYEIRLKKKFGQNFCYDKSVIQRIITSCGFDRADWVLEIGAGTGVLTIEIAKVVHSVIAVEIDTNLRPLLLNNVADYKNTRIIFDDILRLDMRNINPSKVIGNLPYYCASAIIKQWVNQVQSSEAFFMLPDDIVAHLEASPGTKQYTAFSVFAKYAFKFEKLFSVHPSSFFPRPSVGSAFVKLSSSPASRLSPSAEEHFLRVVEGAFSQRRKTLINSLISSGFSAEELYPAVSFLGLDKKIRGEELSVEQLKRLAGFIPI